MLVPHPSAFRALESALEPVALPVTLALLNVHVILVAEWTG